MHFDDKLKNYANLLISHGINVQKGQVVNITAELCHANIVRYLVEAAYKKGAKFVQVDYIDPMLIKIRSLYSENEIDLHYVPPYIKQKYDHFVDDKACVLRLTGSEMPDVLKDVDPKKINTMQNSMRLSLKRYYTEGIGKQRVQWTVAAAATPAWGQKVFPDLGPEQACMALWEEIFSICRADKHDCLDLWKEHNTKLKKRSAKLNDLKIKTLHFIGPGTDLKVGLSPLAVFKAGGDATPEGISFEANIPTEECFTTPDCRTTEGKVKVTRPVTVNGQLVKGLSMEFKDGKVINFKAEEGENSFAEYIQNDPGASRLGEVALVGTDSPVYQSGHVFEEILFDENAACHIALGLAYRFCIENGATLSSEELEKIGCNDSRVHTDFMISSDDVDVFVETYEGKSILLIQKGRWAISI